MCIAVPLLTLWAFVACYRENLYLYLFKIYCAILLYHNSFLTVLAVKVSAEEGKSVEHTILWAVSLFLSLHLKILQGKNKYSLDEELIKLLALLWCYTEFIGNFLPTCRDRLSVSSSRVISRNVLLLLEPWICSDDWLTPLTSFISLQAFRDPLRAEFPHVRIFMNDGPNPLTWDAQFLSFWFCQNESVFQD